MADGGLLSVITAAYHWWQHALVPLEGSCPEYCLHFWEVVGIWLSGIATLAAVLVSLYLARRNELPRLRVSISRGFILYQGGGSEDTAIVSVANHGLRDTTISSVGFSIGTSPTRFRTVLVPDHPASTRLPHRLGPDESLSIYIPLRGQTKLAETIVDAMFVNGPGWRVKSLRVAARTSSDYYAFGRVAPSFRQLLKEEIARRRAVSGTVSP